MENPEVYSDTASPGRESLGEGSADLEKLLQTAEAENMQMVKFIDTERQRSTEFQKHIEETIAKTEQLEESTKNLDVEAKQLHSKFKQNREICEGLKKTSTVLDEHEEALRKKLEMVSLERQTQLLQHQQDVEKYETIWASYAKKYEENPIAKELSRIKETAMKTEASVREVSEHIARFQSQIIEMEVEKTHMQEYLQGTPETATDSIIKIAGLFLGAESTATEARGKVQELKNMKNKLEPQRQMELTGNENESNMTIQSNEILRVMTEPVRTNELQPSNEVIITSRPNLNEHQTLNLGQELVTTSRVSTQANQISVSNQASYQQNHGGDLQEQQHAREQAPNVGQTSTVDQVAVAKTPSSNQHNREQGRPSDSQMEQSQQPPQETTAVTTHAPTTPTASGHVTPVNQSASGTPVNLSAARSPLDFNKHMQYIRQTTESPGQGFTYTGRSMYGNNNQVNEQQQQEDNQQNEADGMSYEAPLNDHHEQHDISLNFFHPFEQQQEKQDQNLFSQVNSGSSPARNRNIFNPSPSNSATSSPGKGFSFGSASPNVGTGTNFLSSNSPKDASTAQAAFSFGTSSSDAGNDFLSSSSPGGNMFGQNNNQDNESFGGGFSLFGSSSSPKRGEEDNAGGFSFSFGGGGKSPSSSNNSSSGFFRF